MRAAANASFSNELPTGPVSKRLNGSGVTSIPANSSPQVSKSSRQSLQREEVKMCAIKQSAVVLRKLSDEDVHADVEVHAIRKRADHHAAGRKQSRQPPKCASGIDEMLEHVAADHQVEFGVQCRAQAIQVDFDDANVWWESGCNTARLCQADRFMAQFTQPTPRNPSPPPTSRIRAGRGNLAACSRIREWLLKRFGLKTYGDDNRHAA